MQQVVTASRLRDGAVVFFSAGNRWVEQLGQAAVFSTLEASTAALQSAQKDEANNVVVDVYAIDVADRGGVLKPVKLREAIRAQGPTVHPEHGKPTAASEPEADVDVSI